MSFIVVGGVAAVLNGAPISTFDLDIVHARDPDNVKRLLAALGDLDARYRDPGGRVLRPDESALSGEGHHLLMTRCGPVDVLGRIGGGAYPELIGGARAQVIGGMQVRVLGLQALIRAKEAAGRPKDLAVLAILRRTLEESGEIAVPPFEIREETPGDVDAIRRLNAVAFETSAEARLVDALRTAGALTLSLVAEADGAIVGHIAFSPVTITSEHDTISAVGLAPMAVAPARQRSGIGGALIADGLCRLTAAGHRVCIVLGHADYYPRHGFVRASTYGIRWEHSVPDDVFFVQELMPGGLAGVAGVVRYHPAFDAV